MNTPSDPPAFREPHAAESRFEAYAHDYGYQASRSFHAACAALTLWSLVALLWCLPVPPVLGREGAWAGFAIAIAALYYWRLSRPLGLVMAVILVAVGFFTHALYTAIGAGALQWIALAALVCGGAGILLGRRSEGRAPGVRTSLVYLMIGPAWQVDALMRRLRIQR